MTEPQAIEKLARLFAHFPGIGPRQAKRFVYFLLAKGPGESAALIEAINAVTAKVKQCPSCHRFFDQNGGQQPECDLCRDPNRDHTSLMIVEKDADIGAVEHAGAYLGQYFVLGGLLPILEKEPAQKIRSQELTLTVQKLLTKNLSEIIIALAASSEGDNTIDYLKPLLTDATKNSKVKISILGRGLSTGSELEYADTDTLKNALKNRA
jgi:recombination protein RecR